jgi:WD40 repeat protein
MRRFRFHIAGLLILVLILGLGFAALREASDLWDSGVFTLTLGALLVSLLLVVHRTETKRAFWIGFATFGWSYIGLTSIPSIESRLLTTRVLAYLDSKVPGRPVAITGLAWGGSTNAPNQGISQVAFSPQGTMLASSNQGVVRLWDASTGKLLWGWGGTTENFIRIGHSLLALALAWLGGKLSRYLRERRSSLRGELPV